MNDQTYVDSCEEDCVTTEANQQLKRELLQSEESTLATTLTSRRIVSLGISPEYVKHWTSRDAFRELYQNWYVLVISARHGLNQTGKTPFWKDFISTAETSSLCSRITVIISRSLSPTVLSPTSQPKMNVVAHSASSNMRKGPAGSP